MPELTFCKQADAIREGEGMNEVFKSILAEWRGGGLERCLAGEDVFSYTALGEDGRLRSWSGKVIKRRHLSGRRRTLWQPWEDAILRENYRNNGVAGCGLAMHRTKNAIKARAVRLGVQGNRRGRRNREETPG